MINKYHGIKFPKSKKGYLKMSEDMTAFYEQILDKTLVESSQWPSVLETESKDFKVGEIIAYLYLIPYPATQRTKSTTNKPKSNQSSWAKSSYTWKRTEWSMFGRMMKRYPLIPSLSRMRNKPISTLQGLLRWTSMRMINFLRICDSLKAFDDHEDYHIEKIVKLWGLV